MKTTINLLLIFLFVSIIHPLNGYAQRGPVTAIERFEAAATERTGQRLGEALTRIEISPQLSKQLATIPENSAAKIAQTAEAQQAARQIAVKETERLEQQLQRQQQEKALREATDSNQNRIIEQARLERQNSVAVKRQQEEAAAKKTAEDKARQESARLEMDRIGQKRLSDEVSTRTVQTTKLPENSLQAQASIAVESGNINLRQQELRKAAGDFSKLPVKAKEDVGYALQQLEKQKGELKALEERAQANATHAARTQETKQFLETRKQRQQNFLETQKQNEAALIKKKQAENNLSKTAPPSNIVTKENRSAVKGDISGSVAASNVKQGNDLKTHLRLSETKAEGGVKELSDGRIRYYESLIPAKNPGEMAGRRFVHELDPSRGRTRGWNETLDHEGNIRQVRPQLDTGIKTHYKFDKNGNYTGKW